MMFLAGLPLRPDDREGLLVELFPLGWKVFLAVSWSMAHSPACIGDLRIARRETGKLQLGQGAQ